MSGYGSKTPKRAETVVGGRERIEGEFADAFLEKDADGSAAPIREV